jgi:hypothetical protein
VVSSRWEAGSVNAGAWKPKVPRLRRSLARRAIVFARDDKFDFSAGFGVGLLWAVLGRGAGRRVEELRLGMD